MMTNEQTLSDNGSLALLVLGHLVQGVLAALVWAEGLAGLGDIDHPTSTSKSGKM